MLKSVLRVVFIAMLVVMWAGTAMALETFRTDTETLYHDPDKAQPGYNMFTSGLTTEDGDTILVITDLDGGVVNMIPFVGWNNSWYSYMLANGNILAEGTSADSASIPNSLVRGGGSGGCLREYDWEGNIVWQNDNLYGDYWVQHHDMRKIYNKTLGEETYMFLTWEGFSAADAIALGADPDDAPETWVDGWSPCGVREVTQDGTIIWRWSFADHIVQNFDASKNTAFQGEFLGVTTSAPAFGNPADFPNKLDINGDFYHPGWTSVQKDWTHTNSMDYNEDLGHVVVNAKHMSEIFVFDHDGTCQSATDAAANWAAASSGAGDFLYRFGNPAAYGQGDAPGYMDAGHHQFFAAHNIHWVGKAYYDGWSDLPGEGNLIIFDNGSWNPVDRISRVIEWNPFMDANLTDTGNYVNPPEAGYNGGAVTSGNYNISNQVQFLFQSNCPQSFYSYHISSVQRMPNGNTVVDAGSQGHFFEVTPEGEVVWEYVKPTYGDNAYLEFTDGANSSWAGIAANWIFRVWRIPADHPGLVGKDLSSQGTLTQMKGLTRPQIDTPTFSVDYSASSDETGVSISGTVMNGAIPVNAMVLCSGQYTFASATDGTFSMSGLPTEADGTVVLQVYAYGHAPFQVTVTP